MKISFNQNAVQFQSLPVNTVREAEKNKISERKNITSLAGLPEHRYMVNFGANKDNLESLYNSYGNGNGMPFTFDKKLKVMTPETRKNITNVYANYRSAYAEMEDCHTVEELKEKFPNEFEHLQSALSRKESKGSFISQVNKWAKLFEDSGEYLFPETKDNDLSVYLAKKIYFEAKTKDEIKKDFKKDLNTDILTPKDIEGIKTCRGNNDKGEILPESTYTMLGLTGNIKANGFRHSLMTSREDYIRNFGSVYKEKRKGNFAKTVDGIISPNENEDLILPNRKSKNYEKYQYAMYIAWNNSFDLRVALSDFLIKKAANNSLLKADLMEISSNKKKDDLAEKQHTLMSEFWKKNPEYKNTFSQRCQDAFDIVEKAIDSGTFPELKIEVLADREQEFEKVKELKEAKEEEIKRAEEAKAIELKRKEMDNFISDKAKEIVSEISEFRPIPKDMRTPLVAALVKKIKVLETLPKEEAKNEFDKFAKSLDDKLIDCTIKTFAGILNNQDKDKRIYKKVIEYDLKKYGFSKNAEERELHVIRTGNLLNDAAKLFVLTIFSQYLVNLTKDNREIGKPDRKKMLLEIKNKDKEKELYKNHSSEFTDELINTYIQIVTNIPNRELLNQYKRSLNSNAGIQNL